MALDAAAMEGFAAPIISLVAIVTISLVIWNMSRRFTTMEVQQQNMKEELHTTTKGLAEEISRQKIERQEDIGKALLQEKEELNMLQKQIDSSKGDLKGLLSKIEVNDTRIAQSERVHEELRQETSRVHQEATKVIQTHVDFFAKWNQRIEDRIEDLRRQLIQMYQNSNSTKG